MARRRILPAWLLFVAFVVVPLAEIFVLIRVGQVIGPWWTILLLLLDSILGAWLMRREGRRAWAALRSTLGAGVMPTRELADGALIVLGGAMMLSPGFVTDVLGIVLIAPPTRAVVRRLLTRALTDRVMVAGASAYPRPDARTPHQDPAGPVVRGDVVD